ncbi:MAG TPA: hypothetical protein VHT70_01505 [Candidatus Saccharimonadales bacterium]|jgi:hypothetical protein|nr:hypothetical protein [Candidatus Saccharimonadales bacterium]
MPSRQFYQPQERGLESLINPVVTLFDFEAETIIEPIPEWATDTDEVTVPCLTIPTSVPDHSESTPPKAVIEVQPAVPGTPEARSRRFMEIASCSPEVAAEQRSKLDAAVASACATAPSMHDKQSIQRVANILRWKLFGNVGDTLPEGLVITEVKGDPSLSLDTRKSFTAECAGKAYHSIMLAGGISAENAVLWDIDKRMSDSATEVRALISATPANALLRSFDAQGQPQTNEVPLDQRQRAIEEEKVRRQTLQQFGMGDDVRVEDIPRGSAVDNALRRAYWRIDNQTQQRQEPQTEQSAFDKARLYFAERLADAYIKVQKQKNQVDVPSRQEVITLLCDTKLGSMDREARRLHTRLLDYKSYVIYDELQELSLDPDKDPFGYACARETLKAATDQLFVGLDLSTYTKSLASIESQAYSRVASGIMAEVGDFRRYRPADWLVQLRDQMLDPQGEYVDLATLEEAGKHHQHLNEAPMYVSQEALQNDLAQSAGSVQSGGVASARIIQTREKDTGLPAPTGQGDLQLTLHDKQFTYADPAIPGYTLVGRSGNAYEFTRDATDPYVAAYIPISDNARQTLAQEYKNIGLRKLAAQVTNGPTFTVEQLRSAIQAQSHYPLPTEAELASGTGMYSNKIYCIGLSDFESFVANGKLHVQCTGASQFLKSSLQTAFDYRNVGVANGLSIDPSTTNISAAGHQQTTFYHNGKMYILDATPGVATTPRSGEAPNVPNNLVQQVPAQVASMRSLNKPPRTTTEELRAIRSNFERHLRIALKAPDTQTLYERVAKLPETTDPVRRTLSVTMRASSGGAVTKAEADALVDFLDRYKQFSAADLRSSGLPVYERQLLDLLSASAQAIAHTTSA